MTLASRTIRLRERQARLCRLRRLDLDFLLTHHGRHLHIEFLPERHWYRLTPRGIAGVITSPTCQLWIQPKLPWANFARLLDSTQLSASAAPACLAQAPRGLPDFLLDRFLHLLHERIGQGLLKGYAEQFDELLEVRGRIDVAEQMRKGPALPERLACHFDELSVDIPCNRLLKSIGQRLLHSPWLDNPGRRLLESLLPYLADVQRIDVTPRQFAQALADPRAYSYRLLLELGRMLLQAHGGENCSDLGRSFLVDMEQLFERYVTMGVDRFAANSEAKVEAQSWLLWHEAAAGQSDLPLRPDVIIRQRNSCSVLDMKWKDFSGQMEADDLHQILAYAGALRAGRAALIYPGRRHRLQVYTVRNSQTQIEFITLRMVGTPQQCERSLQQLVRRFIPE
ncbi:MAG TPA: hypothetical protein VGZ47_14125 [Gemmataceae bacterium]|jgi:5-methylcytosine-specific restriction enzyme subunit McrC|nr:hypothetical protein [Gemmataceae bacterium]